MNKSKNLGKNIVLTLSDLKREQKETVASYNEANDIRQRAINKMAELKGELVHIGKMIDKAKGMKEDVSVK